MKPPSDALKFKQPTGPFGPWIEHLTQDGGLDMGSARKLLEGYEAIQIRNEVGEHMATLIKMNKEVHLAIYRKWRGKNQVTRNRIHSILGPILQSEQFLVTKCEDGDDDRFVRHLGFQPMGRTMEGIRTYILTEIKYPQRKLK